MINLVVALLDEAKPLIDFYQLKQVYFDPFPVYENNEIRLILSKIGALSSACAVTTLHHLYNTHSTEVWLNIGLAGHSDLDIGQGSLVSKVMHSDHRDVYYPSFIFDSLLAKCPLKTLTQYSSAYEPHILYDMEGFGYYQAASRYATLERTHLYKIISDNAKNPVESFNRNHTKELIQGQLQNIDKVISTLKKSVSFPMKSPHLSYFLSNWHFTQTQRCWLEKHMPILHYHKPSLHIGPFKGLKAKEVLLRLKKELKEISL